MGSNRGAQGGWSSPIGRYEEALRDFRQAKYLFPDERDKLKAQEFIEKIDKLE